MKSGGGGVQTQGNVLKVVILLHVINRAVHGGVHSTVNSNVIVNSETMLTFEGVSPLDCVQLMLKSSFSPSSTSEVETFSSMGYLMSI